MSHTLKTRLFFALSAALGVVILHGISFFTLAVCLYAAGTALIKAPLSVTYSAIILGGLSLLIAAGSGGPALIMIGALLVVLLSESPASRYLFSLCAAAILIEGSIHGLLPLIAALFIASPVNRDKWRTVILAGGAVLLLIITGIPSARENRFIVLQEVLCPEAVVWAMPAELNLGMPELILKAPGKEAVSLRLEVSAGGVRDNDPVGYVTSAGRRIPVYPGENTLIIEDPEFPVSIRISRPWKPFSHPVIHFYSAEATI